MGGAGGAAAAHTEAAPAVEPGPGRIQIDLSKRQQQLLDAFLILATIAAAFIVLGFLDNAFKAFQDIIILFFLAWLLSFALLPLINVVARLMPGAPRAAAVVVVYSGIVVVVLALLVQVAALPGATRSRSSSGPPRSWRPSSGASSGRSRSGWPDSASRSSSRARRRSSSRT